jgi:HK97 family phage portal protein
MINKMKKFSSGFLSWLGIGAATYKDKDGWFVDYMTGGTKTTSGERISNDSAMTIAAVYACINNIATDVAKLPIKVYQKKKGYRTEISDHPIRFLLDKQPNNTMTAMDFRQALTAHCLGWGNAYAEVGKDPLSGDVSVLRIITPDKIAPQIDKDYGVTYKVTDSNNIQSVVKPEYILHIHGLGFDGVVGYNVIHQARESMGLAKATERFGSSFFGNGTVPGGFIEHPTSLTANARQNLIASIERRHQTAENAHKLMVLEEGMKFNKNTIPPEEAQFLETRQFSIPEICRWFRMPPHKIADLSRATFSNIEEQSIEYVTDTLMPWCRRWEQAIWMRLLSEQEKKDGIYVEHVLEGLLRGNIQARYIAYQVAIGNNNNPGFMTVNEIRERENLNPVEDGDELFTPQSAESPEDETVDDSILDDMASRIASRETQEIESAKKKYGDKFELAEFYKSFSPKQEQYIIKTLRPLNKCIVVSEFIGKTKEQIKELLCQIISKH